MDSYDAENAVRGFIGVVLIVVLIGSLVISGKLIGVW